MLKCLTHFVRCYSKRLSEPGVFPLKLQADELQWKLALCYDAEKGNLLLYINNKAFLSMP